MIHTKCVLAFFITFISIVVIKYSHAQGLAPASSKYPQNYFRAPLQLPPQASGNFGELRSNHFHTGTDYRTNQREGYPVYAVADGYVSRARVQIGGGGNALYINHPNGYTSVYMHLQRFNDQITDVVKNKQYVDKRFDVDFPISPLLIQVKKGDIIAYSGNTGGSAGPHLHFELRDTQSEHPINAQLFGLTIPDRVPPNLGGLTIYRLGNQDYSENTPREHVRLLGNNGKYKLNPSKVIQVNGRTGFGIIATDRSSTSANQNGIYSIELRLDGKPIYHAVFESLSFENNKAINAHIDYAYYILHRKRIQKSFIEPGNPLEIYQVDEHNGTVSLQDTAIHKVAYRVQDVMGNSSELSFNIQNNPSLVIQEKTEKPTAFFAYDQENAYENEEVKIHLPKNSLYSNLAFMYRQTAPAKSGYSAIQHIHNTMVPLHRGYSLAIKAINLPQQLQNKALIVSTKGGSYGGIYKDGYVTTTASTFGSFYIQVDTIAPTIRSLNLAANSNLSGVRKINFKISDNLAGIQSFNGYIDGKWILMEYDYKRALLWHTFETGKAKGKHHFKLVVKDWKDNERVFEANFSR